jgi:CRISPR-associated protein Csb2
VIGIQLRFLAGRFHGNGWSSAHNEGIPEWPPSPWRVLRALVSAAYAEGLAAADVEPLVEKLRALPRYHVPRAVDAHTRHYMPDTDDANHKKAKVFDPFVAVEGGARDPMPVTMGWNAELTTDERALLARLCRRVSYLGRAESWAELSTVDRDDCHWNCQPDEGQQGAGSTTLLALSETEQLSSWLEEQPPAKKGADIPRTLWDVLTFDSERYRAEGWSAVPGTRLVRYIFAEAPFRRSAVASSGRKSSARPTVARFAIRSAVLPRLHEAIAVGERLRMSAMSQSKKVSGEARQVFSGHGDFISNHRHAMYLSTSDDSTNAERGFIDHLVIAARAGFEEEDVLALQKLRRLWGRSGHDLDLVLVGLGQPADYGGLQLPRAPVLAESRVWESVTPFVPTRYPKVVRGADIDSIEEQLRRSCEQLLGVRPVKVSPIGDRGAWSRFRRRRLNGGGSRGPDRAFGARLIFEQPVRGPIAVGYGAHFGLGLFVAVDESAEGDVPCGIASP